MRSYGPGQPLVFSHIPKTAGTSLRIALQQILQPTVFVQGVDTSLMAGYDDLDSIDPITRASIYLSPEELPADATLVGGHIGPGTTMARYPGADHITILRVPHIRMMSQWLHGRSLTEFDLRHWGTAAAAFRVARRPLHEYLQHRMLAPNVDNTITRFLAFPHPALSRTEFIEEKHDDELVEVALQRLASFQYVNVVENPAFMTELAAWLGHDITTIRANERTSVPRRWRPDLSAELDPKTRELLDYRHRLDTRVWSHVVTSVLPGTDPQQLLEKTIDDAVGRYAQMLQQPAGPLTLRRVVAAVYGVGVGLDPRRRDAVRT